MRSIYMSAYDIKSYIADEDVLSSDKLTFDSDKPFFLICNVPIKDKTMFEIKITEYYPIFDLKHIPLYVGVSKQIASGILTGTYSMSSLYYDISNPKYDIMSNYNGASVEYHQFIDGSFVDADGKEKIGARKPGVLDTIGVGVDIKQNTIFLFVNYTTDKSKKAYNKPFYSFHPPFDMSKEKNLRFCIWSDIYYKRITDDNTYRSGIKELEDKKHIKGRVNFGEGGLEHPVPGFTSLFSSYYAKYARNKIDPAAEMGSFDNPCTVHITGKPVQFEFKDIDAEVDILNELDPVSEKLSLISDHHGVTIKNKVQYSMDEDKNIKATSKFGDTDSYKVGANIFINYPIPKSDKIYFEYTVKDAQLKRNMVGIPISMGISSIPRDPNILPTPENITHPKSIMTESIRMNLYRGNPFIQSGLNDSGGYFQYWIVNNGEQNTNANNMFTLSEVESSVSPEQGVTIGVSLDLANNTMIVNIDGFLFTTLIFPTKPMPNNPFSIDVNHSIDNRTEYAYFFIHNEGVFEGTATGKFNFGKTKFNFDIPEGYTTLYDFYNVDKRRLYCKDIEAYVNINAEKITNSYIFADLRIDRTLPIEEGLNRMIDSDNIIDDIYVHYYDMDADFIPTMFDMISRDNNGYVPELEENMIDVNFEGVPKYRIHISKYKTQYIQIFMNGKVYTESFDAPENALITTKVLPKSDLEYEYSPGVANFKKAIVGSAMYITASPATYKEYTVTVIQTPNQTITVYHHKDNGIIEAHTGSFVVNSRYPNITAEITDVREGFIKGKLNITSATIKEDTTIISSTVDEIKYKVTIKPTVNQEIIVTSEGIPRSNKDGEVTFLVGYKKSVKIEVVASPGYFAGKEYYYDNIDGKRIYIEGAIPEVSSDISIDAEEAKPDICDINITRVKGATTSLTGYDVKLSDYKYQAIRGKELTVKVTPSEGYYLDHIQIDTNF